MELKIVTIIVTDYLLIDDLLFEQKDEHQSFSRKQHLFLCQREAQLDSHPIFQDTNKQGPFLIYLKVALPLLCGCIHFGFSNAVWGF